VSPPDQALGPFQILVLMMAGAYGATAARHWVHGVFERRGSGHGLFTITCVAAMGYTVLQSLTYQTHDVERAWRLTRLQDPFIATFLVALALFVGQRLGRGRVFPAVVTACTAAALGLSLLTRGSLTLDGLVEQTSITLPWGEVVFAARGRAGVRATLSGVFVAATLLASLFLLARSASRKPSAASHMLWLALVVFGLAPAYDVAVAQGYLHSIQLSELTFFFVVAALDVDLSLDMRRRAQKAELASELERNVEDRSRQLAQRSEELQHEIAERRRAEEAKESAESQLLQAQKMEAFGQLAGGLAHDFNNLLTVISGNVQLAEQAVRAVDLELSKEALSQTEMAISRASALTHQLLTFARQDVVRPVPVVPRAVVAELEPVLRGLMRPNTKLSFSLAEQTRRVRMDPTQLEQVVLNLVINASDAMPEGGAIEVRTRDVVLSEPLGTPQGVAAAGHYVEIDVADTGQGIPPAVERRIFEPFFTTKGLRHGTGLGLATVDGVLRRVGGHAVVTSVVGTGTRFSVRLPAIEPASDGVEAEVEPVG
jgi:signal transduction histidine kinase